MQTVMHTPNFQAGAQAAGIEGDPIERIVDLIAAGPQSGDQLFDINGLRRRIFTPMETGADANIELVFYVIADDIPIFLLDVCFAGEALELAKTDLNDLASTLLQIESEYRASVRNKIVQFRK